MTLIRFPRLRAGPESPGEELTLWEQAMGSAAAAAKRKDWETACHQLAYAAWHAQVHPEQISKARADAAHRFCVDAIGVFREPVA